MSTGAWNPKSDLPLARADAVGYVVGASSTENVITLRGVNLGNLSLANGWVRLDAGALGAGTPATFAEIASNTATTLIPSVALSAPPADGYQVWIYSANTVQVIASENIAQVGGVTVPTIDGTPSVPVAAGSDGTNVHALSTDGSGRINLAPQGLVWDAAGYAASANTNIFATSYQPPTAGVLSLSVGIDTATTAPHVVLVKTANSAPSGGSAGTRTFQLNGGGTLAQGQILPDTQIAVTPNDSYNLQFDQTATVDVTATFKAS